MNELINGFISFELLFIGTILLFFLNYFFVNLHKRGRMATLLIETSDIKELKLIKDLLNQMRIKSREIKLEEDEDLVLGQMMIKEKTDKLVSKKSIIEKLKSK